MYILLKSVVTGDATVSVSVDAIVCSSNAAKVKMLAGYSDGNIVRYNITYISKGDSSAANAAMTQIINTLTNAVASSEFTVTLDNQATLLSNIQFEKAIASTVSTGSITTIARTSKPSSRPTEKPVQVSADTAAASSAQVTTIIGAAVGGVVLCLVLILCGVWRYASKLDKAYDNMNNGDAAANVDYGDVYGNRQADYINPTSFRNLNMSPAQSMRMHNGYAAEGGFDMVLMSPITSFRGPYGGGAPVDNSSIEMGHLYAGGGAIAPYESSKVAAGSIGNKNMALSSPLANRNSRRDRHNTGGRSVEMTSVSSGVPSRTLTTAGSSREESETHRSKAVTGDSIDAPTFPRAAATTESSLSTDATSKSPQSTRANHREHKRKDKSKRHVKNNEDTQNENEEGDQNDEDVHF